MSTPLSAVGSPAIENDEYEVLDRIQNRVLWLATSMIHHANHVRHTPSGLKVGGHQASSASMTSIMTALYLSHLRADDQVSVKPHAAPVMHAINYLLGRLDASMLTSLRSFHGLQSYPSRTKDPDPVDFSTGSVGIGATATIWSALTKRYLSDHFEVEHHGRHIALVGDAELDEGAIWEAIVDPRVARLGEVLWIVDVNRQSLDRVVPDIAAARVDAMFDAAGWHSITLKYGHRLRSLFALPGGEALRSRIDAMSNEEFQRLLRTPDEQLRERIAGAGDDRSDIERALSGIDDVEVASALRDLGGHDLTDLVDAFRAADREADRPTVVFAYTVKAWRLPSEGHPGNHSALLSDAQWRQLASDLGADPADPWAVFDPDSAETALCTLAALRLERNDRPLADLPRMPADLGRSHEVAASTQQALGRLLFDLEREAPEIASRIVTVSPDVASSTNLGGWINRVGQWNDSDRADWFVDDPDSLVHWAESVHGQHIELGITEGNLVGLLGELGTTWSRYGEPLFPIGTIYDQFINRALEPWSFTMYGGGQSIIVGTPSGVTLASEGGAHQSIITPSVGIEQPGCIAWEPAFGQDLEWTMLDALGRLGRPEGSSAYFRLSTRVIDQALASLPRDVVAREQRRRLVLAGGYPIRIADGPPAIKLVGIGAMMPEVIAAAEILESAGIAIDVICLTSADLIFRALQSRSGLGEGDDTILDVLFSAERNAPIVSVIDGHPHTLSFLAAIHPTRIACLGVNDFGQSGDIPDLYRLFGIDAETVAGAAWDLLDATSTRER